MEQDPNQPQYNNEAPPSYNNAQQQQGQQPVQAQPSGGTNVTIIQTGPPPKPSSYLALAIVTTICFNLIFGIIAIIFSSLSSTAADDGDMESAKTKGKVSLALSLVGIFVTIIIIIIVIAVVVSAAAQTANAWASASAAWGSN